MACPFRSYCITQNHVPRSGITYSDLGPPVSIINQENAPTDMPTGYQAEELKIFLPR